MTGINTGSGARGNAVHGSYSSFAGVDISAVFGNELLGTMQAISYSITREKGPVYTMKGGPNPIAFARGKRAIAGTLVFVMLHEASLINHFKSNSKGKFWQNRNEVDFNNIDNSKLFATTESAFNVIFNNEAGIERSRAQATYVDQLLPFDVNLSASNESGNVAKKSFLGVELTNEGGGVSIDDLVIEEQYTYICRELTPWMFVGQGLSDN